MSRTIWVGAVAYDPKVVGIWEGMRRYFHEEARLSVEVVLFQSYEAQVAALLALPGEPLPRIDIALRRTDAHHQERIRRKHPTSCGISWWLRRPNFSKMVESRTDRIWGGCWPPSLCAAIEHPPKPRKLRLNCRTLKFQSAGLGQLKERQGAVSGARNRT